MAQKKIPQDYFSGRRNVTPFDIALILIIAAGGGSGLVFIGVLIQWSLRKARRSRPPRLEAELPPAAEL
ncbi:hypothetical protein, partial [Candidatus Binatus sp.]|uniref:hypothetical protein n=1 Tax=Candidatus Binatus sp. TaxID=2811406 RepID=UPI003C39420B